MSSLTKKWTKKIFASLTMIEFSLNKRKSSFEVKSTNHYFWAVQYFWKKEVATKNRKLLQKKANQEKVNSKKQNPNLKSEKPRLLLPVALIGKKQIKRNLNSILILRFFFSLFLLSFIQHYGCMDIASKTHKKIAIIIIINYYYYIIKTATLFQPFFSYFVFLSLVETFSTTLEKYTWVSSCYITRQLC